MSPNHVFTGWQRVSQRPNDSQAGDHNSSNVSWCSYSLNPSDDQSKIIYQTACYSTLTRIKLFSNESNNQSINMILNWIFFTRIRNKFWWKESKFSIPGAKTLLTLFWFTLGEMTFSKWLQNSIGCLFVHFTCHWSMQSWNVEAEMWSSPGLWSALLAAVTRHCSAIEVGFQALVEPVYYVPIIFHVMKICGYVCISES